MRILLTNDDGIFSPGLAAMARVLRTIGEVTIAAPATEQSGVAQRITFLRPLTALEVERRGRFWGWAVEGSPVDCVKLGIAQLCGGRPDLVVSGMNNGLNAGANLLYSGTVAATLEGGFQGITSIAVSAQFAGPKNGYRIEQAADAALPVIERLLSCTKRAGALYNINIPFAALDLPALERKIEIVPMDRTCYWDEYTVHRDPTGRRYYWLAGRPDYKKIADSPTDFGAVSHGKIAVTPLTFDTTDTPLLEEMKSWSIAGGEETTKDIPSETPELRLFRDLEKKSPEEIAKNTDNDCIF